MDGLQWKTLLKWMIWGEKPLFSETSKWEFFLLTQVIPVQPNHPGL